MSSHDISTRFFGARLTIVLGIFVVCCAIAAFPAKAKHATFKDQPDDQTQSPALTNNGPQGGRSTIIHGEMVELHDRLAPAELRGIRRLHRFTVTLSGANHVSETWTNGRDNRGGGQRMRMRGGSRGQRIQVLQDENDGVIGDNSGHVVWHVLGPKKLQRIFVGEHFLMMVTIEIDSDNKCSLEAKYLQQTGFESITMLREDNAEPATYGLPHVEETSCTIE
jgi:hypothetical protein